MEDKILLVEKDLETIKEGHGSLEKKLQEILKSINDFNSEKDKIIQAMSIKVGEFQAITRTLETLRKVDKLVQTETKKK